MVDLPTSEGDPLSLVDQIKKEEQKAEKAQNIKKRADQLFDSIFNELFLATGG